MKWAEVRELFPNQFVLVSILDYVLKEDRKIVTEVAPIRKISDQDANNEFFSVKPGQLVYHTSNEECIIHLRNNHLIRVSRVK